MNIVAFMSCIHVLQLQIVAVWNRSPLIVAWHACMQAASSVAAECMPLLLLCCAHLRGRSRGRCWHGRHGPGSGTTNKTSEVRAPECPDRCPCPDARALHSVSCSTRAHVARVTRGEGRAVPPIQKDAATTSYGCPAGVGREDTAEGGEERCNTGYV
jgi:hypothetical protein